MPNFTTSNTVTLSRGGDGTTVNQTEPLAFFNATPVVQQASAAAATDATTAIVLANAMRTAMLNYGLII